MSINGKEFFMDHSFKEINTMEEQEIVMGPIRQHFGIPWQLSVKRVEGHLNVFVNCNLVRDNGTWSISTEVKGELVSSKGGIVTKNFTPTYASTGDANTDDLFLSWENLEKDYLVDGSFQIHVEVKIVKTSGLPKKKLMHFDAPDPNETQGVLVVEGEKFYVNKTFLAFRSTEFDALFFAKKANMKKKELQLDDIKACDFQNFLEVIHSVEVITDETVEGILKLAKQFKEEDSIKKCVKFLLKKSGKSFKEKLKIAKDYDLEAVKNHCLLKLDTKEKILSVVPGASTEMDPSVACFLLKKIVAL